MAMKFSIDLSAVVDFCSYIPPADFEPLVYNGGKVKLAAGSQICIISVPAEVCRPETCCRLIIPSDRKVDMT
jgi:hypothetical protein